MQRIVVQRTRNSVYIGCTLVELPFENEENDDLWAKINIFHIRFGFLTIVQKKETRLM